MPKTHDITTLRRIPKSTDPNRLKALIPGELYIHDHSQKRTRFPMWMAINRRRSGVKYRCTHKHIEGMLPTAIADRSSLADGFYARFSKTGRYYQYFEAKGGIVERARAADVPELPDGFYAIWIDK